MGTITSYKQTQTREFYSICVMKNFTFNNVEVCSVNSVHGGSHFNLFIWNVMFFSLELVGFMAYFEYFNRNFESNYHRAWENQAHVAKSRNEIWFKIGSIFPLSITKIHMLIPKLIINK